MHDRNGHEVKVGDEVLVHGKITSAYEGMTHTSVAVEMTEVMHGTAHKTVLHLTAGDVEVVPTAPATATTPAPPTA